MKNRVKSKSILQVIPFVLGMLGTAGAYETTQDVGLGHGDSAGEHLWRQPTVKEFLQTPPAYRYSIWMECAPFYKAKLYPLLNEEDRRSVMVPRKIRTNSGDWLYQEKLSHNDKLVNFPCIPAKERFEFWKNECSSEEQSEMFKYLDEVDQYRAWESLSDAAQELYGEYLGHPVPGWDGYGEDNRPWELYK